MGMRMSEITKAWQLFADEPERCERKLFFAVVRRCREEYRSRVPGAQKRGGRRMAGRSGEIELDVAGDLDGHVRRS